MSKKRFCLVTGLCLGVFLWSVGDGAFAAKKRGKDKAKPATPSQPPQPLPATPAPAPATDYSDPLRIEFVGKVVSIDAAQRTLTVKGESRQQGKVIGGVGTHTFVLAASCFISTPKKTIATLDDVAVDDHVQITYGKSGDKNAATSVTVSAEKSSGKK
jgi:hypothetical protein